MSETVYPLLIRLPLGDNREDTLKIKSHNRIGQLSFSLHLPLPLLFSLSLLLLIGAAQYYCPSVLQEGERQGTSNLALPHLWSQVPLVQGAMPFPSLTSHTG